MTSPIDIRPDHLAMVQDVLRAHLPDGAQAWVFGSRATWTTKDSSDLDLAVQANGKIAPRVMGELEDAFRESDLPYTVDVVDLAAVDGRFKEVVESQKVSLPLGLDGADGRSEWRMVKLSDVAEIVMGQSPPGSTYNEAGVGLPFFQGVRDFNYRYPTLRVFCSAPTRIAKPGDILLSVRAPIGRVNVADRECAAGRGLAIIRPHVPSDARYIEFLLRNLESSWDVVEGSGSVFGNATRQDLESLSLRWPTRESERRAIAHILGTLDDKIDLNRRMNETLEEMARALFTSWFVDYDPVRAKIDGRWRRGESLPGLPADLYDLFPARMVESELGGVPEGWEVRGLGEVADVSSGKRPQTRFATSSTDATIPVYGGNGPMAFTTKALVDKPIIITGRVGTLGTVYRLTQPSWPTDNTLIITPTLRWSFDLLYHQIQKIDTMALNRGSTQPLLTQSDIKAERLVIPGLHIRRQFAESVGLWYTRIEESARESSILATLRDTLLPRLVSGEVWVGGSVREKETREQ